MYAHRGADGYISPVALTRRLRFIPDRWEKGFSKQVQAWGSRAHFMQVRVLFFMRHWFNRLCSGGPGLIQPLASAAQARKTRPLLQLTSLATTFATLQLTFHFGNLPLPLPSG